MVSKQNKYKIEAVFSSFVALIPILQYYKSPLPGINLATLLSLMFMIVLSGMHLSRRKFPKLPFPILYFVIFITCNVIWTSYIYNLSLSWHYLDAYIRMLILIGGVLWLGSPFFNSYTAFRTLRIVLTASSMFMVIQLFSYYVLGIGVSGKIPSLLSEAGYAAGYAVAGRRASGFYMEPAHYAQSATLFLCWGFWPPDNTETIDWKSILIVIAGVIMSGSGQGYLFLCLLILIWYATNFILSKISIKKVFVGYVLIVLIIISFACLLQVSYVQQALSRILHGDKFGGVALAGRTWTNRLFFNLPKHQRWYGVGYGRQSEFTQSYMNALFSMLFQCGYLSLPAIFLLLLGGFMQRERYKRIITLIYGIMIYFAAVLNPMMICYYCSFIYSTSNNNKKVSL